MSTADTNVGRADLREILEFVEDDLAAVEVLFEEHARSDVPVVAEVGRYVREGGGKRIRPALLLLAARLCGHRSERAVLLAAVVEFIHTATLLHDDIIDDATLRRGRRSVNSRWGNDITVLLGDYLYTKSMSMALSQDNLPILRILSDVTLKMVEGELLEIQWSGSLDVDHATHIDIVRRKTAWLFAACTRIAGVLGGVGDPRERALADFGLNLGICFQMVDDLLDFTASESRMGKPVLADLREGKVTLPAILLLERGGAAAREGVAAVIEDRGFDRVSETAIVALATQCGALSEARALAEDYAERARADLNVFAPSPIRDALASLPDFVLARDH